MSEPVPVVICDDSRLARKQMAAALRGWNVAVTFAEHGLEALEAVRAGKGDLVFLDLTMPIMDGYQTLERIRCDDLPAMVIVVSADIQPEARVRVLAAGALDFIKKPSSPELIAEVLQKFGLLSELEKPAMLEADERALSLPEYYQEVANIAMGQAGNMLARLLNTFVHLPIPAVSLLSGPALAARLQDSVIKGNTLISQGFIGKAVAGEALLMVSPGNLDQIALLMGESGADEQNRSELMISLANALIGAFMSGLAKQLDLVFSKATPQILHDFTGLPEHAANWQESLVIEVDYQLQAHDIHCRLLLVFTPDALPSLQKIASYFE